MHTFIEPLVGEICRQLSPFASAPPNLKERLPFANEQNIQVEAAKNGREIRFRFMTHDDFEMNLDVDFIEMRKGGQAYIDNGIKRMLDGLDYARKHRQKQEAMTFESIVANAVAQPNPETRH